MHLSFPRMRLTVIGSGYLGLTHAVCMADSVFDVLGERRRRRPDGESGPTGEAPFFEPGLEALLRKNLESGRLRFTTSVCTGGRIWRGPFPVRRHTPVGRRVGGRRGY